MSAGVRGNLLFAWLALISAALAYMAWAQFSAGRKTVDFEEINVHRINVVEPDGKPRLILSNRARMAGIYWEGKEYRHHNRDWGGMLFFNDDGDEVGGFLLMNRKQGDKETALTGLLFDQYKHQETLTLTYGEENRQREAGLTVYDQPDQSIFPALKLSDQLAEAKSEEQRKKIQSQIEALAKTGDWNMKRFFAGKVHEASLVELSDKKGRPRLVLKVDAAGTPSVQFLDENGKIIEQISPKANDR